MRYDPKIESLFGAFPVAIQTARTFRALCMERGLTVTGVMRKFVEEVVANPQEWFEVTLKKAKPRK